MFYGHDPREVRQYAWQDVVAFLDCLPMLQQSHNYGGLNELLDTSDR